MRTTQTTQTPVDPQGPKLSRELSAQGTSPPPRELPAQSTTPPSELYAQDTPPPSELPAQSTTPPSELSAQGAPPPSERSAQSTPPPPSNRAPRGSLFAAFDRFWRPITPATRLAALRILVGVFALTYLLIRLPHLSSFAGFDAAGFRPTGIVSMVLGQPLAAPMPALVMLATLASGLAFVLGWRFALSGPIFAAALLWVTSYRNSWGMIFHTENLMVMHVIVLSLGASADAWSLDARRRHAAGLARAADDARYGWPLRLAAAITIGTYMLAGIAKLRHSGLDWVSSDILRNYIAFDNLRKVELGDNYSQLGAALSRHPALFPPLAALSIGFEIFAPLAFLSRRFAQIWSLTAWAFHVGVLAMMWIFFPYPLFGLAYAPLFELERLPFFRRLQR